MSATIFKKNRIFAITCCLNGIALSMVALGQTAPRAVVATGEVTGHDVYVRSGPSLNHYTICKLAAGDRVQIVGDRGEWFEILPPAGTFSLISSEYVDTMDNKDGVVNGTNVRVRAGSMLNNSKYTVQTMLSKGAEVTILGENPDGFLRIAPPAGATMWMSREYVAPVPDERLALERGSTASTPIGAGADDRPTQSMTVTDEPREADHPSRVDRTNATDDNTDLGDEGRSASGNSPSNNVTQPPGKMEHPAVSGSDADQERGEKKSTAGSPEYRNRLGALDTQLGDVMNKPIEERDFTEVTAGFRAIADQTVDDVARQYATHRLTQIETMAEMARKLRELQAMGEDATSARGEFLAERTKLPIVTIPSDTGFDVTGELRVSSMFDGGSAPRRYRIVDDTAGGRTVAYAEIPSDSNIKVEEFIGTYVGIRAARTQLLPGAIQPIPVYTVAEIVAIDRTSAHGRVSSK